MCGKLNLPYTWVLFNMLNMAAFIIPINANAFLCNRFLNSSEPFGEMWAGNKHLGGLGRVFKSRLFHYGAAGYLYGSFLLLCVYLGFCKKKEEHKQKHLINVCFSINPSSCEGMPVPARHNVSTPPSGHCAKNHQ